MRVKMYLLTKGASRSTSTLIITPKKPKFIH